MRIIVPRVARRDIVVAAFFCCLAQSCDSASAPGSSDASACTGFDGPCDASLVATPLVGCTSSNYGTPVTVGDHQPFTLMIDTGSTTAAIASVQCSNCSGISPLYTPQGSAQNDNATASSTYDDGTSWNGDVYTDTLETDPQVGDVRMRLVAIDSQASFFRSITCPGATGPTAMQGILGLGGSQSAMAGTDSYVDQLPSHKLSDSFAVQLANSGGNMWLGGYVPSSLGALPQFTPLASSQGVAAGLYMVNLQDVQLGGTSLGAQAIAQRPALVDTGTNNLVVTSAIYKALQTQLEANSTYLNNFGPAFFIGGTCAPAATGMSQEQLDEALPHLTFIMPGVNGTPVTVDLKGTASYLRPGVASDGNSTYCSAVLSSDNATFSILGNNVMHSHVVIFDRAHSQVGFAPQVNP